MHLPVRILTDREFDVLGFGTNAVDYLITVPNFPEFASKVELNEYVRAAGGEIASTMVGMQRLGARTSYAGRFGNDDAGRFGLSSLQDEGVDLALSRRVDGAATQIAFIVIDERSGERTVIWKRDARLSVPANEAPVDAVSRCGILHMTPHDTAACIRLAESARKAGTVVSLDIDNVFDGIEVLLPLVDILITSSEFPKKLLGMSDTKEALTAIQERYRNALVGMTLGERGSAVYCAGEYFESPGFAVPGGCKDTTGAGDAFRTGLLYGLLRNEPVEVAAEIANSVAALKCRKVGARTALPLGAELEAFLKKR
jgi:sugar/nucleoside kinase (ribokinase family)